MPVLRTATGQLFEVPRKWDAETAARVFGLDADGWPIGRYVEPPRVWSVRPATAAEIAVYTEQRERERAYTIWGGGEPPISDVTYAHEGPPSADGETERSTPGYEMLYGMTLCCGASYKGLERGVGCRKCYRLQAEIHDTPYGEVEPIVERAGVRAA